MSHWNCKYPKCGAPACVGLSKLECSDPSCENRAPRPGFRDERPMDVVHAPGDDVHGAFFCDDACCDDAGPCLPEEDDSADGLADDDSADEDADDFFGPCRSDPDDIARDCDVIYPGDADGEDGQVYSPLPQEGG